MLMKERIILILIATVILALAGCTNDEFVGSNSTGTPSRTQPIISFGSNFKAVSRADIIGADAAALLNNRFIVTGYKGTSTDFSSATGDNQSVIVFDNYQVVWEDNSANSTETNVANWEYANKEKYVLSAANAQTVKYWDNNFPQYDFIAYSLGINEPAIETSDWDGDMPKAGKIGVSAINPANLKTAAYTLTGSAADLGSCYIADIVTVSRTADGYSKEPVTIKFRNLTSKVRIALYETVFGYDVKDVKFYTDETSKVPTTNAALYGSTDFFRSAGTYTVYYPTINTPNNSDNNVAHVTYSGNAQAVGQFGAFPQTAIGQTSAEVTYAGNADGQYYTAVLPQEEGAVLNLRVDFTLESTDGLHETIKVYGATAQVPATYSKWQPGYAYTYIFKISDKTTGYTDPDHIYPEGLYPITFDTMVVVNGPEEEVSKETEIAKEE